ncbi:MAG: hypothetical protein WCA84_06135 [Ignavibacteriaceae bacterium]
MNFQNLYKLSQPAIIPYTETIKVNGKLLNKNNFIVYYSTASFKLADSIHYSIFDTITVTYLAVNISIKKEYENRSIVYKFEPKSGDTLRIAKDESNPLSSEAIFGSYIEKSGTLVRGFTVGTTQDLTLTSGLRLQISGKLSNDIDVIASITDDNTPIQPEGNTATLDELDKVFIQVKHPNVTATFGDYDLHENSGEFGVITRKLEGLMAEFNYDGQKGYVAVASAKGKFTTSQLTGSDGVQGPYQLYGANGENSIIIIAGTENVYVDGIQVKRGERNDYTVDYANAQITFTTNKLITSASRITVDFQYTDMQYTRNFFGAGIQSELMNNNLGINFQYLQEGDDKSSPIDVSLSDSDKTILAAAGNNRFKATKSGVALATADSQGVVQGTYQAVDTLINNKSYIYYLYNPGNTNSIYTVTFSYVGQGNGDYINISIGDFKFVGINQGSYAPIIFLPMPESKQLADLSLNYKLEKGMSLQIELAGSLWNQNTFSSLDQKDDGGYARNLFFKMVPGNVEIGNLNLGQIGFSYKDRYIESTFASLDRIDSIEYDRDYNISDTSSAENEELREFNLTLIPANELNISSTYSSLKRGEDFSSSRFNNTVNLSCKNYSFNYNLDYVSSDDSTYQSSWLRQKGSGYYSIGILKPGFDFLAEDKLDTQSGTDTLLSTSLKYYEIDPYLNLLDFYGIKLTFKYTLRDDYLPLNGIMMKQSTSTGENLVLAYNGIKEINSTLTITIINKDYEEAFKNEGYLNNQTILVNSQSRFNFWSPISGDFYYQVSTQKSAKLQQVFVKVAQGAGNYIYLGDLNHDGLLDVNDFQQTLYDGNYVMVTIPTAQLYPVIDLKTSSHWRLNYREMADKNSLLGGILKPFTSEIQWKVEENTQEQDYAKIYLLDFSDFQNPAKTINGTNYFQHDLFLFENDPEFSSRIRYNQAKSLNQYSSGLESAYTRERSIRLNIKLIKEISNQTDIVNGTDNLGAPVTSIDKREIKSNIITSNFSYHPVQEYEFGFKLSTGQKQDDLPDNPTIINLNSQTLSFIYSFAGTGRLKIQFERDELVLNNTTNYIPFEMTESNLIGKNFYWGLNFDYKLSANLQSTLSYTGRLQAASQAVHTAKAEVRAYF